MFENVGIKNSNSSANILIIFKKKILNCEFFYEKKYLKPVLAMEILSYLKNHCIINTYVILIY